MSVRDGEIRGLWSQKVIVGSGGTQIEVLPPPGNVWSRIKYPVLGGTLEISGSTGIAQGLSYPVQAVGSGYVMDAGESVNFEGAARFYLRGGGATSIAYVLYGLGTGYQSLP